MNVKINRDSCIGCARCSILCPSSFEMNERNKAVFVKESDCIEKAIEECPYEAISIEE